MVRRTRYDVNLMTEPERLIHNIVVGVSVLTGVPISRIYGRDRRRAPARARQLAMRRLYDVGPEWSMPRVGRAFQRDHSTVYHALKQWPEGS